MRRTQRGFAFLELILGVVVVAALGLVSYKVYQTHQNRATSANQQSTTNLTQKTGESSSAAPATTVPDVTKKSDLDSAQAELDQTDSNADSTDQAMLSGQENDF